METVTPLYYYTRQKREFVCLNCTLPICAEGDTGCLYELAGVFGPSEKQKAARIAFTERSKLKSAIFKLGFAKYDKRRKPDTPQRMLWRSYKEKKKDGLQANP